MHMSRIAVAHRGRSVIVGPLIRKVVACLATRSLASQAHPLRREVLLLLQVAMVVFVWTVVIGILNGTDLVDFSRKTVLSHVHAGTLGWITMCVFAASLWLFGATASSSQALAARVLALAATVTLPAFALTFALTFGEGRAVMGTFALRPSWFLRVGPLPASGSQTHSPAPASCAAVPRSWPGHHRVCLRTKIATGRDVIQRSAPMLTPGPWSSDS